MPRTPARRRGVHSVVSYSVRHHGLEGCHLVVAASSGADSTALLHSLYAQSEALGLTLHVAHFDHNFRPEAAEDARFVAQITEELGLSLITEHADPMAYQREQKISSFEAAARELRYRFLGRAAESAGAAAVALGHNAGDQAETVLMHLIRGTGLDGLRGMDGLSVWHSSDGQQQVRLFRPLLTATKDDLRCYCQQQGIAYREDPANRDMRFTRNQVRHQLLPLLREYNPRVSEALVRFARAASDDMDFLDIETDKAWTQLARTGRGTVSFDRAALARLPKALQARILRKTYEELAGSRRRLQQSHVDAMMGLLDGGAAREVVLPFGLRLVSTGVTLDMISGPQHGPPTLEGEQALAVPQRGALAVVTGLPGWKVHVKWSDANSAVPPDPLEALLDVGHDKPALSVRGRRRGDRFQPYGMAGEKKLQDFLVNQKVAAANRDAIPLVVCGGMIAWVVGHRVANWAAVTPESRYVLSIRFEASGED